MAVRTCGRRAVEIYAEAQRGLPEREHRAVRRLDQQLRGIELLSWSA